jgi:ectoine hydroxylase-related dioxygenase (phytanoyl-CoA dioxygenase family)
VIRGILGEKMILGSVTAVASLGGSKDMHIHKDHPALFSRRELEHELPSFGVSMILPLLGFSEELGTTRVWKGSHQTSLKQSLKTSHQDPYGSKGACLLMDYRLTHQGLANRTDRVRPILDLIYQRPWFRDIANYGQQEAMVLSDANYDRIPEEHRSLFDWSRK